MPANNGMENTERPPRVSSLSSQSIECGGTEPSNRPCSIVRLSSPWSDVPPPGRSCAAMSLSRWLYPSLPIGSSHWIAAEWVALRRRWLLPAARAAVVAGEEVAVFASAVAAPKQVLIGGVAMEASPLLHSQLSPDSSSAAVAAEAPQLEEERFQWKSRKPDARIPS